MGSSLERALVGWQGFEPWTNGLKGRCSTTELPTQHVRPETSGGYYALLERAGKQFRRSLKTKDRKLAERRLAELRGKVGALTISEDSNLTFEQTAKRWLDTVKHSLSSSTVVRKENHICDRNTVWR